MSEKTTLHVPSHPPGGVEPFLTAEPRTYWDVVLGQFRKNRISMISLWIIVLLFLLSAWAPLIVEGKPLIWHEAGETSYPLLEWLLAPTRTPFSVEYLFNYFLFLTVTVPLALLIVHRVGKTIGWSRQVRRRWSGLALLGACIAGYLPFVGPGTYERPATQAELARDPDRKTRREFHILRRWKLVNRDYLLDQEKLDASRGDYALFPLFAQDPLLQTGSQLHPPGTYALFSGTLWREVEVEFLGAPAANVSRVALRASTNSVAGSALQLQGLPENCRVALADGCATPPVGETRWFYGDLSRDVGTDASAASSSVVRFHLHIRAHRPVPGHTHRLRHCLGTESEGRDVLARLLHGGRLSLSVGLVAVALEALLGILIGGIAGYFRGWVDILISRFMEIVMCFPSFFMIITLIAVMEERSIILVMVVIGVTGWTGFARLTRGEFLKLAEQDFVHSARALGCSNSRVMFKHMLPNAMGPLLVSLAFSVAGAVGIESSLAYLGFGAPPPTASWGEMVRQGMAHVAEGAWWLMFFPGFLIFLTLCVYNLAGDGLRDAMDPKLRK